MTFDIQHMTGDRCRHTIMPTTIFHIVPLFQQIGDTCYIECPSLKLVGSCAYAVFKNFIERSRLYLFAFDKKVIMV